MFGIFLKFLPRSGRTSRYLTALQDGDLARAERLLRAGVDFQAALVPTVQVGSEALLRKLVLAGADPTRLPAKDFSKLLETVRCAPDAEKIFQTLLDSGIDPNAKVGKLSALNHAILKRDVRLVRTLLKNGANGRERDLSGFSPMEFARALEENGIAQLLQSLRGDGCRAAGILDSSR